MIPVDFDFAQDFESVCICGTKSKRDSKRTARWEDPEASVRAGQIDGESTQKHNTASKRLTTMSKHNLLQVWRDFKPVLARIWAELHDAYLDTRFSYIIYLTGPNPRDASASENTCICPLKAHSKLQNSAMKTFESKSGGVVVP